MRPIGNILLITRNFPPLQGGMERLILHLAQALASDYHVVLCGPDGAGSFFPEGFVVREVQHRPLWRFLIKSFGAALMLSVRHRPKAIFGGSGLIGPAARIVSWLCGCPAIVYLHGLDIVVDHPLYRLCFLPFIRRCDLLLVNSHSTRQLAINAGIPAAHVHILHPGTSLPDFPGDAERAENRARFIEKLKIGSAPILLSVGRLTQRKGLCEFIKMCLPDIVRAHPDCLLLVIGDAPKNALLAERFSQRKCAEKACLELGLTNNVRFLGEVDDATLAQAYQNASALIFPVIERPGDIEGFGMVAIEAAAHGTPTLAFAVGGVPDAVSDGVSGRLLAPGDYAGMRAAVLDILDRPGAYPGCRAFAEKFAWPVFGEQLRRIVGDRVLPPSEKQ